MAEEQRCHEGHHLCANNCGFFGSLAMMDLCSKVSIFLSIPNHRILISQRSMEASCFLTSKSFNKTLDLLPFFKPKSIIPIKKTIAVTITTSPSAITCKASSSPSPSPPSPDNGREPPSELDWRSFRARLFAGEQKDQSFTTREQKDQNFTPVGDRWAHPLHEPERGCLLVATEKLDGVHIFERTVVLLLSTGPIGPSGVILNRPSLMSIKEARSTALDIAGTFSDQPLFFGGPLEEGLFLVSPQDGNEELGRSGVFDEVMKGVYYGTKESVGCAAEMVKRSMVGVRDFRFFDGYCGWEEQQLRDEIRAGYWGVVACSSSVIDVASMEVGELWEEVMGLVGGRRVW